jgi:hypothetical protein
MGPVEVNETPKMTNNNAIEGSSLPKANVMTKTVGMPGEQRCNGKVLVRHWALKVVTGQRSTGVHVVLKQAAHLDRHWGVATATVVPLHTSQYRGYTSCYIMPHLPMTKIM